MTKSLKMNFYDMDIIHLFRDKKTKQACGASTTFVDGQPVVAQLPRMSVSWGVGKPYTNLRFARGMLGAWVSPYIANIFAKRFAKTVLEPMPIHVGGDIYRECIIGWLDMALIDMLQSNGEHTSDELTAIREIMIESGSVSDFIKECFKDAKTETPKKISMIVAKAIVAEVDGTKGKKVA